MAEKLSKTARASALKKGAKGRTYTCTQGHPAIPVLYYPAKGRPISAYGCEACGTVWANGVTLTTEFKGRSL